MVVLLEKDGPFVMFSAFPIFLAPFFPFEGMTTPYSSLAASLLAQL
jgi:hypothetical protein